MKTLSEQSKYPCRVADGTCIVCGSTSIIQFWRVDPENQRVRCNDCGSEVTLWMHEKKQAKVNGRKP